MKSDFKDLNKGGVITGIIAWFVLINVLSSAISCAETSSCDGGDLILFSVLAVGMVAPAWICAVIASIFFNKQP
jgi:hypothetical protein